MRGRDVILCLALAVCPLGASGQSRYVSHWGSHVAPYSTWATAATNLATAKRLGQGGRVVEAGEVAALTAWAAQYVERSKTFDLPPEKTSDNLRVAVEQITDRASAGWR